MLAALARAQTGPALRVEKIEVTGSHISRIDSETALPVTRITREEIARSGAQSAAELLDKVSANVTGYALAMGAGDSSNPGLSAAGLRGLGAMNTLVLLNGRRLSNYAFNGLTGSPVNLNQIPLAAVERVEILKDGASAIYGADAIGGVINFILRKDYVGSELSAYASRTQEGGANARRYGAVTGFGNLERDRFNVFASFDHLSEAGLEARQRWFASTAVRPDLGGASVSGNTHPANFVFSEGLFNVTAARGCVPERGVLQVDRNTGAPLPLLPFCRYDFTRVIDIAPPSRRDGLFARATVQPARDHQVFLEYHASRNRFTFVSSESPINDFTGAGPILYPAVGPYYPRPFTLPDGTLVTPSGALQIAWRSTPLGSRTNAAESTEDRLLAGAQGEILGWDYNVAVIHARSKATDTFVNGWVRESLVRAAISTGLIDVFSGDALDAVGQDLLAGTEMLGTIRNSRTTITLWDGKVSRDLAQMPGGSLSVALGAEHRRETLDDRPEAVLFTGDIIGYGGTLPATRASRTIASAFGELSVPLARNLEAQLAARFDDYSDFGGTTNPKVALRWTPAQSLLVRASAGRGFRAPTLTDLHLPPVAAFTEDRVDPARCPGGDPAGPFVNEARECGSGFPVRLGGNPKLVPEKSRQWTLGFVYEPGAAGSIGIDFYSIRVNGRVGTPNLGAIFDVYGAVDPAGANGHFVRFPRAAGGGCANDLPDRAPTPASVPCAIDFVIDTQENRGNFATSGFDVSGTLRFADGPWGRFALQGEGTYVLRYKYQRSARGAYFDNAGRSSIENDFTTIPRWKHYASLRWSRAPWELGISHNFTLGYRDSNERSPRRVGSYETWDIRGSWQLWKAATLAGGVRNLFNRAPPATVHANAFQIGYDPTNTDPRGRTFYLGLRYQF